MEESILVVDSDLDILKSIKAVLTRAGYVVVCAGTGQKALEILHSHSFDIVITDIQMSDMHGLEMLKRIRGKDKDMGLIILTGHAAIHNAVESFRDGGVDDYLLKPLEKVDELLSSVRKALRKRTRQKDHLCMMENLDRRVRELEIRIGNCNKPARNSNCR